MKEGQEQFLTFILDRTKEDKKEKNASATCRNV